MEMDDQVTCCRHHRCYLAVEESKHRCRRKYLIEPSEAMLHMSSVTRHCSPREYVLEGSGKERNNDITPDLTHHLVTLFACLSVRRLYPLCPCLMRQVVYGDW